MATGSIAGFWICTVKLRPPLRRLRSRVSGTVWRPLAIHRSGQGGARRRSEEHTSELQSLMRNSYAVFCLQKKREQPPYNLTLYQQEQNIISSTCTIHCKHQPYTY